MRCRLGQATRRKWFKFVTLNIYCFYTFRNIRECQRGNASKAIDRCSTAIVSRDLSRLRTSRTIMLCGKELIVNSCMRTEMHLLCIYRLKASHNFIHWFDATSFCERNKSQTM